jgi:hypothetical protein
MGIEKAPCISAKCFVSIALLSILEKVRPKRVFFIKNLFLFGRQLVGVVLEHIEIFLFVECENKFPFTVGCINPPNRIGWVILEQFI